MLVIIIIVYYNYSIKLWTSNLHIRYGHASGVNRSKVQFKGIKSFNPNGT